MELIGNVDVEAYSLGKAKEKNCSGCRWICSWLVVLGRARQNPRVVLQTDSGGSLCSRQSVRARRGERPHGFSGAAVNNERVKLPAGYVREVH